MKIGNATLHHGDCLDVLRTLPEASVHTCITSPPYWGLRDYGVEGQIGLEASPSEFIARLVDVFREVRRVLRDDGTLWLNMGDSYAGSWGAQSREHAGKHAPNVSALSANQVVAAQRKATGTGSIPPGSGLKPKDLVGMPWRLAFALQADGWWLRQDIIWHKPNPMPESVRDRCTKAHEYLFLLAKSERYYYDIKAIRERCSDGTNPRRAANGMKTPDGWDTTKGEGGHGSFHREGREKGSYRLPGNKSHRGADLYEAGDEHHRTKAGLVDFATKLRKLAEAGSGTKNNESFDAAMAVMPEFRNRRSVWTVATAPFSEAHFATFPPDLIRPCVLAGAPAGGVVLDPFNGAGTTGTVALEEGRAYVGIELNADYLEMTRRRLDPVARQERMFA